ncbi:hypothetical protein, partial [Alicyclobacillus sp.]|uniref:hypothetical protein n=1 Tax=Alicyclobacillus sp. TaxID=61169 RepID=UPI0025C4FEF1
LALVAATWWPVTPYYHSATPDAARALTEPGPVRDTVAGRITFVLSADTPDVMQAMADGGYRMAMVNEYGYTANSPTRREAMAQLRWSLLNGRLPESELKARVIRAISILQPEYLMYYPVQDGERLPPAATHVLASLFGPPVAVSHGVQVWSVRPSARP